MKRIFTCICFFLIFLFGCCSSKANYETQEEILKTYVYEIHTIGGICDTVKVCEKIDMYVYDTNPTYVLTDECRYSYIDKIRLINVEIQIK